MPDLFGPQILYLSAGWFWSVGPVCCKVLAQLEPDPVLQKLPGWDQCSHTELVQLGPCSYTGLQVSHSCAAALGLILIQLLCTKLARSGLIQPHGAWKLTVGKWWQCSLPPTAKFLDPQGDPQTGLYDMASEARSGLGARGQAPRGRISSILAVIFRRASG